MMACSAALLHLRLRLLLFLLQSLSIVQAGDQYCAVGGTRRIDISSRLEFVEDRIIPQTDGVPVPDGGLNCEWRISANNLKDPVVILSGFDSDAHMSRPRMTRSARSASQTPPMLYELHAQTATSDCSATSTNDSKPVELDMLRVLQLPRGSFFTVTSRLRSSNQNTPGLRMQLMEPGFCGRELPNFDHGCYMASSTSRSLMAELKVLNGDSKLMRLASFNSSSVLQSFVKESQRNRWGSFLSTRSKAPLNLTQKLRIGMFHDTRAGSIFYLRNTGDECKIEKFEDRLRLNFTVQPTNSSVSCGSLRAVQSSHSGEVIGLVEFGDCSEPLPALINFADAARNRCSNCSRAVVSWLAATEESQADERLRSSYKGSLLLVAVVCSLLFLLILFASITLTVSLRLRTASHNLKASIPSRPEMENEKKASTPRILHTLLQETSVKDRISKTKEIEEREAWRPRTRPISRISSPDVQLLCYEN